MKFQAVVYYAAVKYGPPYFAAGQIEIGIRSNDVAAIGWINPDGVPLAANKVSPSVLAFYPLEGMRNAGTVQKYLTLAHLGSIAAGNDNQPIPVFDYAGNPIFVPLTLTDRVYILNWMFKHAANPCSEGRCPPSSFPTASDLYAFQIAHQTSYKMFNRFQITYRVVGGNFKTIPTVEKRAAEIGITVEPIFGDDAPGAAGANNDQFSIVENAITRLVNDGNPESVAVSAFNTLVPPLRWNNIGSRIELGSLLGTDRRVITQVYPTYFIYDNLKRTQTNPQAQHPIGNFSVGVSKPHVP